jgi:hypothetical protein
MNVSYLAGILLIIVGVVLVKRALSIKSCEVLKQHGTGFWFQLQKGLKGQHPGILKAIRAMYIFIYMAIGLWFLVIGFFFLISNNNA